MIKIDMDLYKEIGRLLKQKREEKGISLDSLSNMINGLKTKSTLKRYEDGKSRMDLDTLKLICNILSIDVDDLIKKAQYNAEWNAEAIIFENEMHDRVSKLKNTYGDYYENIAYFADKPELLEIYHEITTSDNLRLLFDSAKDLTPKQLESILVIIQSIKEAESKD